MATPPQNPAFLQVPGANTQPGGESASLRSTRSAKPAFVKGPSSPEPAARQSSVHRSTATQSHRPAVRPQTPFPTASQAKDSQPRLDSSSRRSHTTQPLNDGHLKPSATSSRHTSGRESMSDSVVYRQQLTPRPHTISARRPPTPFAPSADLPAETPPRQAEALPKSPRRESGSKTTKNASIDNLGAEREARHPRRDDGLEAINRVEASQNRQRRESFDSSTSHVSWNEPIETDDDDERHEPQHRRSHSLSSLLKPAGPQQRAHRGTTFIFSGGPTVSPLNNLRGYLAYSSVEKFERWPESGQPQGFLHLGRAPSSREFKRRHDATQEQRGRRQLRAWERKDTFKDMIVDDVVVHLPDTPLDKEDRWGEQRFTVPATHFDTKRFCKMSSIVPRDRYVLLWLNNTVLTSALSALHAIRMRYTDAEFMYVPSPMPGKDHPQAGYQGFADGYGSLVLARGKSSGATLPGDRRALLLSVRPPWPHTKEVLQAFTGDSQETWELHPRAHGYAGIANLLQAQMYDECVAHGVHYWVASTLKWWVFGVFSADYTRCEVSPMIRRNSTDCTVLQCLVTWMRRGLEAEEDEYYSAGRKEQKERDPRAAHGPRPALQRITRRRTTSGRATSSTCAAPAKSTRGEPSRKQSMPQLAEQRQLQRSTSSTRLRRRSTTDLRQDTRGVRADTDRRQERRGLRHERERNEPPPHTYVETYPYVQPVTVQYVPGFVQHVPTYYYPPWFAQ